MLTRIIRLLDTDPDKAGTVYDRLFASGVDWESTYRRFILMLLADMGEHWDQPHVDVLTDMARRVCRWEGVNEMMTTCMMVGFAVAMRRGVTEDTNHTNMRKRTSS